MPDGKPIPYDEKMPATGLRARYENYHALRRIMTTKLSEVDHLSGQIAEAAVAIVEAGGEI
jgi:hypothetical protein